MLYAFSPVRYVDHRSLSRSNRGSPLLTKGFLRYHTPNQSINQSINEFLRAWMDCEGGGEGRGGEGLEERLYIYLYIRICYLFLIIYLLGGFGIRA